MFSGGQVVCPSETQEAPLEESVSVETATGRREWSLRDIPLAVRLAFDLEKLGTGALGLTAAALAYGAFHWLGAATGERQAHRVFAGLGWIVFTCICVLFSGLIARMTTTQLLEGRRATMGEIREFLRHRWTTLLGIPLSFGAVALAMLGLEAVLGLIGSVPGAGPIVYAASFLLAFMLSLVAVMTVVVHTVGAFLYPSIVALRGVGAVGAIMEVVDTARRKPLHVILYELLVAGVGSLMTLIIGVVVWASLHLTVWLGSTIMQEKFDDSLAGIPSFFRVFLKPFAAGLPFSPEELEVPWHYDASGILMGISLLVVVVLTLVYPFVFFTSAGSITWLILREDAMPAAPDVIDEL